MKRTALILAGAAAFDLGVMAVAAQAQQRSQTPNNTDVIEVKDQLNLVPQQRTQTPPTRIPTTSTGPTLPGPDGGGAMGQAPAGTRPGDCVLRPGQPVLDGPCGPAAISDQAAAGNLTSFAPTAPSGGQTRGGGLGAHKMEGTGEFKIDRVNTIQACTARGGEVVPHQGAQHCLIPAPSAPAAAPVVGNRRPGASPPLRPN